MYIRKMGRNALLLLLALALLLPLAPVSHAAVNDFDDVPPGHWAYEYVTALRDSGIMNGVGGNRFGPGRPITRAEFVTTLCRVMNWPLVTPEAGSFPDNQDKGRWYYPYIETALQNGAVISDGQPFRPLADITREDMAVMLVRALGYESLTGTLSGLSNPFTDVTAWKGHIMIAKDFGIINGVGNGRFAPKATAKREEAAAMLVRMYEGLSGTLGTKNAFYAISSASQMDAIGDFDSISFGWARLIVRSGETSPDLDTSAFDGNEYILPKGYEEPYGAADGKIRMLMAAMDNATAEAIAQEGDAGVARRTAMVLLSAMNGLPGGGPAFDGLVLDLEGLTAAQKDGFTAFVRNVWEGTSYAGKLLYVAVHPARRPGVSYYDGYDFRAIGEYADKVILMAHDYNAKSLTDADRARGVTYTPLTPIDEIYYALHAITDPDTGVRDRGKVLLQLNFAAAQWKLKDGKTVNAAPYTPSYDAIFRRISTGGASIIKWDEKSQNPYLSFHDDADGTDNIVWYEDTRSVDAKLRLAGLFGVGGVSVWRLGLIPDGGADSYMDVRAQLAGW